LLLGVSLYTVIADLEATPCTADWFWIGMGFAPLSSDAFRPFAQVLLANRPDLVMAARSTFIAVLVSLALARGFLCPSPPMISSSSPRSSRSSS
jgi:hypothetical protein